MPFYFLIFILIFAPLAYGTTGPVAMMIVQAVVFCGLLWVVVEALRGRGKFYRPPGLLPLGLLGVFMALQAIPLPAGLLEIVSPAAYQRYTETVWLLQPDVWMPVSVSLERTLASLFFYLTCVGLYLLATQCLADATQLKKTVRIVTTFAGLYALVAILEALVSNGRILWVLMPWPDYAGKPFGTYVNGNHFAGLMAMLLPLCFMLYLVDKPAALYGDWKERLIDYCSDPRMGKHLMAGSAALLSATGVFLSLSRGGIISMLGAMLILCLLLLWRKQYRRQALILIGFIVVLFFFVGLFGWEAIFERFARIRNLQGDLSDGRLSYWADCLALFKDFPLFGSGFGSFIDSYAGYQTLFQSQSVVDHAHNDYVELLAEAGLTGLILAAWAALQVLRDSWQAFGRRRSRFACSLYLGALVGICALLLHSVTEFNLHIGANALYFAFLAALLVALSATSSQGRKRSELPQLKRQNIRLLMPMVVLLLLGSLALNGGGLVAEAKLSAYADIKLTELDRPERDAALQAAREAMAWAPLSSAHRYFATRVHSVAGEHDEALQLYGEILQRRPLRSFYLQRAAATATALGQNELAGRLLRSAVAFDRVDLRRIKAYAQWLLQQQRQQEAFVEIRRGLELVPQEAGNFISLMLDFGVPLTAMTGALPERALAWQHYANILVEAGHEPVAEQAFRQAITLAPSEALPSYSAHWAYSRYLEKQQRYEEAIGVVMAALELFPEQANLHAAAGSLYERQGISYRAEEEYRQALLLNPGLGWVRKKLERF